jgi:hypothetical protein
MTNRLNIQPIEVIEKNLKAEKCLDDFGGLNMWDLYIYTSNKYWKKVQWMGLEDIQELFKTKLPKIHRVEISHLSVDCSVNY